MKSRNGKYSQEFKLNAVKLVEEEGLRASQVARDLGILDGTLSSWLKRYREHGKDAYPGKGRLSPRDEELSQLKKDLRVARMERDILKKTIAFFAEQDRKNMRR